MCKLYNIGTGSNIGSSNDAGKAATGDHVQASKFTPRTKELILAILRFTRLLLENATNRKLYASFDVSSLEDGFAASCACLAVAD